MEYNITYEDRVHKTCADLPHHIYNFAKEQALIWHAGNVSAWLRDLVIEKYKEMREDKKAHEQFELFIGKEDPPRKYSGFQSKLYANPYYKNYFENKQKNS